MNYIGLNLGNETSDGNRYIASFAGVLDVIR